MDQIKLQNFAKENPDINFPFYESLSASAAEEIKRKVCVQMRLPLTTPPLELVTLLRDRSVILENVDCESDAFNLKSEVFRLGIVPEKEVFINWNSFDRIDVIKLEDFSVHFDDIWYPSVDDIDIFDDSLKWILSVGYSGDLSYLKFT